MRLPWQAVAGGTLVMALGAAGLVRGALPQHSGGTSVSGPAIVVSGAYIRPPVPPTELAAGYFTVQNRGATGDRLLSVQTGAGGSSVLHTGGPNGVMSAAATGADVPAHGSLVLSTGGSHVMIGQLFGRLTAGSQVNMVLTFRDAGEVDVVAPVVPFGQQPPAGAGVPTTDSMDHMSGAHS